MKKLSFLIATALCIMACSGGSDEQPDGPGNGNGNGGGGSTPNPVSFSNPIVGKQLPDPTIIHAADGNFYLYVTQQDNIYIPIYKSTNMTQWTYAGAAFLQNRTGSRTLAYGLRTLTISMVNMCSIILLGTGTCLRIVVSGWRSATLL